MCHVCHPTSTSGPRSALHTALATRGLSPSSARGGRKKLRMEGGCDRHVGVRGGVCAPPPASPAVLVPFSPLWPERRDHRCCGMQPRGRGRRRLAPSPRASTRRCALAHTNACARSQPQPNAAMPTVSTNINVTMTMARQTTSRAPCAAPPGAEAASPRPRARDRPPRALVRSFVRSVGRSVGRSVVRSFVRSFVRPFRRSFVRSTDRSIELSVARLDANVARRGDARAQCSRPLGRTPRSRRAALRRAACGASFAPCSSARPHARGRDGSTAARRRVAPARRSSRRRCARCSRPLGRPPRSRRLITQPPLDAAVCASCAKHVAAARRSSRRRSRALLAPARSAAAFATARHSAAARCGGLRFLR